MSRHIAAPTVMNQPVDPLVSIPSAAEQALEQKKDQGSDSDSLSPQESFPERLFKDAHGVRLGWRLFLYFALTFAIARMLGWVGQSFFSETGSGVVRLWQEFYEESISLVGAMVAAMVLARLEHRSAEVYGLPRSQAFGRLFWIGVVWGFCAISILLLLMHGMHVFDFGSVVLHGSRVWKFAVFWAGYFVIVGLFEEMLFRGYFQRALTERAGFWSTAALGSIMFGGIHLFNGGESAAGAVGAGLIGLFFCFTLLRTGTLWFAVGFHAAWDWGETFFYAVPNSGTTETGHLLSPRLHGNVWLTGGTVGPEASVLLMLVIAALWLAFDRMYRTSLYRVAA
jgi:uncharacterized protein